MKKQSALYFAIVYVVGLVLLKSGVGLIVPIYPSYLRHFGLDYLAINLVNMCFYAGIFIFDIPSGLFADHFGRKKSVIVGLVLRSAGFLLFYKASHWMFLVLGELMIGAGLAFFGAALQAWLVDNLADQKSENLKARIFGIENILSSVGIVLASLICGKIVYLGYRFLYLVILIASLFTMLLLIFFMKEIKSNEEIASYEPKLQFKDILAPENVSPDFLRMCLISAFFFLSTQGINLQWQSWAKSHGASDHFIANIFSLCSVLAIVSVLIKMKLLSKAKDKISASWYLLFGGLISLAIFIIMPAISNYQIGLIAIVLQYWARGGTPVFSDIIANDSIKNNSYRATYLSVISSSKNIGAISGLLLSGVAAQFCSATCGWIISGSILLVGLGYVAFNKYFAKKLHDSSEKQKELCLA